MCNDIAKQIFSTEYMKNLDHFLNSFSELGSIIYDTIALMILLLHIYIYILISRVGSKRNDKEQSII